MKPLGLRARFRPQGRRPFNFNRPPVDSWDAEEKNATLAANEPPQYPALADALSVSWTATQHRFRQLRSAWFRAVNLTDPASASRALRGLKPWQVARLFSGQRNVTSNQLQDLDAAIEEFLKQLVGEDRTSAGYADPENAAILQESGFLSYRVGYARGEQLAGQTPQNAELTDAQKRNLSRDAFARLSEDGRLRFETRLDDIKAAMLQGFEAGTSPLEIARKLGADLDGYEQGRLRTIVRTETAYAAIGAQRDVYKAQGIERVQVIGNSGTDELCTSHIGNTYPVGDADNLPPYHPSCLCDLVPVVEADG